MQNKRLNLSELKVKSFITDVEIDSIKTLKGGAIEEKRTFDCRPLEKPTYVQDCTASIKQLCR